MWKALMDTLANRKRIEKRLKAENEMVAQLDKQFAALHKKFL
ncbi:hypothetical protein Bp8pC_197 [Bacillus phage Bp8p-C]|uniref:Uncharacterized protein n=2 Tax=Agatevirus Bp8pC TaxID=1910937 RepID=A0A0A0PLT5_9CAUD|nr:hypothetical protein AXJ20_gp151 [Bacillus phage Bp8p-C]YP_009784497.1 hypothetical protein QLX39_gp151 [Bacillus phage Bp8p-T]AHJ87627.1 hypothetical protein Bp8pC_197 [Bacillus phage Bp8p-C]AHJ87838.1 hypothetical protein Bp8pT_197 [Bacillus phage Bp8p-T]